MYTWVHQSHNINLIFRRWNKMANIKIKVAFLSLLMLTVFSLNSYPQNHQIPWEVLDGGGGQKTSANYQILDAICQVVTGEAQSPNYINQTGYIYGIQIEAPPETGSITGKVTEPDGTTLSQVPW
jgi:hypothetical protein